MPHASLSVCEGQVSAQTPQWLLLIRARWPCGVWVSLIDCSYSRWASAFVGRFVGLWLKHRRVLFLNCEQIGTAGALLHRCDNRRGILVTILLFLLFPAQKFLQYWPDSRDIHVCQSCRASILHFLTSGGGTPRTERDTLMLNPFLST